MLEDAFSFRGRIGRMRFFLNSLLIVPAAIVGAIVFAIVAAPVRHDGMGLAFLAVCLGLFALVAAWFSLSLYVRRIRDIGWDPFVVIIGWVALGALDIVLAAMKPSLAVGPHGHGTVIGGLLNFGLSMAILFWPGRDGDDADDRDQMPRRTESASTIPARGRNGFGRRGAA